MAGELHGLSVCGQLPRDNHPLALGRGWRDAQEDPPGQKQHCWDVGRDWVISAYHNKSIITL